MSDYAKKFKELFPNINENIDENIDENNIITEEEILDTFDFLDESILRDIQKAGLFKGLKRFGRKAFLGLSKIIKDNPKLKEQIGDGIKKYGQDFVSDATNIMGEVGENMQKKIAELEQTLDRKEKEWERKEKEYKKR